MHFLDFLHVIFCLLLQSLWCIQCVLGILFPQKKEDIPFCSSGFKVWKSASDTDLQKWPTPAPSSTLRMSLVCNSISLSRVARVEGQSCVIAGVREDGWIHTEGVFNKKVENFLVLIHITDSGFKFSPQLFPKPRQILCGRGATAETGHLWWQLWVLGDEWNLCQVYIQGSYFVLGCSDCIQHVARKLISALKL